VLYKFMSKGKQINSAIAMTEEEAAKICGLKKEDYDKVETEKTEDEIHEVQPTEKKTRQPRSDKGTHRVEKPEVKSRKKPEYFVFSDSVLSRPLDHKMAIIEIETAINKEIRVIMGHEISFSRTVSFHVK